MNVEKIKELIGLIKTASFDIGFCTGILFESHVQKWDVKKAKNKAQDRLNKYMIELNKELETK